MSISSLIGTRILSGLGALALTGSIVGGTAVAASPAKDNPVRELRHELRDDSKAEREEIKALRAQLADEYAKESPNLDELRRLHDAIEAKQSLLRDMRFEAFLAMHDELDAAARERAAEHLAHGGKGKGKGKAKGKDKAKHDAKHGPKQPKSEREDDEREDDDGEVAQAERGKAKHERPEQAERGKAEHERPEQGKAKREAKRGKSAEHRPV